MNPNTHAPHPRFPCTKVVDTFDELMATQFDKSTNALCWGRALPGDFDEIAIQLSGYDEILSLEEDDLYSLNLSKDGQIARDLLLQDLLLLRNLGLEPNLDCIPFYPRDSKPGPVATDVYSFHVDTANTHADTFLCSYNLAPSEGLVNSDAVRKVDIPETRSELLKRYGKEDDEGFTEYLRKNHFDLHYLPVPNAAPYSFGLGNLWRIATDCPNSPTLPCIHRAPTTLTGQPPRLLLIS
jgi:hypothetical protein